MERAAMAWVVIGLVLLTLWSGGTAQPSARAAMGLSSGALVLRTLSITGSAIAVDERTSRVFIVAVGAQFVGHVSMLDARSGILLQTVAVGTSPTAADVDEATRRVFVLNQGSSSVSVLDAGSGRVLSTIHLPEAPTAVAVDERTGHVYVVGRTGPSTPGAVNILDAHAGNVLQTVHVSGTPVAVAVDARTEHVFVASIGTNSVSVLNAMTGIVLRTVHVGANPAALAVDTKTARVFVTNSDEGSVSILNTVTGTVLRIVPGIGSGAAMAVDEQTARVFVTVCCGGDGHVSILDAHSGSILHTVNVGNDPASPPAVDTRTDRVYVLVAGPQDKDGNPTGPGSLVVLNATTGATQRAVTMGTVAVAGGFVPKVAVAARTDRVFALTNLAVSVLDATRL